ncbi:transcription antitermination factor NusB [Garciella nitratireducens]|uniref:transcription antitermination factor NusB n=1 Tax=Garciella nitratireducens TaxID=218205 RepID=UPI000DE99C7A|nr:transcription antitermination factor NusB [Garciella nitratireducens]RBP46658.1 NusB antitermination factor [Garciella nitratireducens]
MKRRKIREMLLQITFQMDFQKKDFEKSALHFLLNQSLSQADKDFAETYLKNLIARRKEIDSEIEKKLKGWTLSRLSKIDLAILRLGTYEILFEENIPNKVSINEAVELAKKYSEEESKKFINGVLDAIARE